MIADKDTNFVFFSDLLRKKSEFRETCTRICEVLDKYAIEYDFLEGTKDIWARDYMPIQVSKNKFIEYRYDPDYLQGKWKGCRDLKTYPDIVCDLIQLTTYKSDIILDGGNVVKSNNCLILTDKVVVENRLSYSKTELIKKLKIIFEVEKIILTPWDKKEKFGHSDGVLRFINNNTVLINEIYEYDTKLLYRLKQNGIQYKFLRFNVNKRDKRNWAYINFLQTKDLILIPKFEIDEDEQALEQIKRFYPDYAENDRITQIDMTKIVKYGGALNCITWTKKD